MGYDENGERKNTNLKTNVFAALLLALDERKRQLPDPKCPRRHLRTQSLA